MGDSPAPPAGFEVVREGGTTLVLRSDLASALRASGVDRPEEAAAAAGPGARSFEGRGRPVSFPVEGAPGLRVVARRYLRGGLLRGLAGDLFPGSGRFLRELRVAEELRRRGAPVPEPLGVVVRDAGAGTARGWFLSREAEGCEDLRSVLRRLGPGDPGRRGALRAAGRAVRRFHDAGGLHGDLHVKNLLVGPGGEEALVADLDGARVEEGGLSREQRAVQILRLDRSLVKLAVKGAAEVPPSDRRRLVRAYLGADRPTEEESLRWRRRQRSELRRHGLGWRLGVV
jgi:tRNA A-37 threonylcarbamoyl transferase component Bud32